MKIFHESPAIEYGKWRIFVLAATSDNAADKRTASAEVHELTASGESEVVNLLNELGDGDSIDDAWRIGRIHVLDGIERGSYPVNADSPFR